jgi:hypothetical protein
MEVCPPCQVTITAYGSIDSPGAQQVDRCPARYVPRLSFLRIFERPSLRKGHKDLQEPQTHPRQALVVSP